MYTFALALAVISLAGIGISYAEPDSTISVTGSAAASVKPDTARIWFAIETLEETASGSLAANSELARQAINSVRQAGVTDEQISTAGFDIWPEYESHHDGERHRQELVGYRVINTVVVQTGEPEMAAAIIDAAVSGGANRVDRVEFGVSDELRRQTQNALVSEAVRDAAAHARHAIAPLGYHISGVVSVDIFEHSAPFYALDSRQMAASSAPPIFAGDQEIAVGAGIVFEISQNG